MRAGGYSLLETLLVLGLLGVLCGVAAGGLGRGPSHLALVAGELRAVLDQGFLLARARGAEVRLVLGPGPGQGGSFSPGPGGPPSDVQPLILPRGVRWGLPQGIGPPRGRAPVKAHLTGAAHPACTVTPRGTAMAGAWYLTDEREALYMGVSGHGRIRLLRWRRAVSDWEGI